jgi:hypothetical protein
MNNYKIFLLFTIGVAMSLIWSSLSSYLMPDRPLQIQIAMAQNDNTTASTTTTTTHNNSSINLGDPIFTEHDKAAPPKKEFIKSTYRLQSSYSGSGMVKGVNFSVNGTVSIVPRIDGAADVTGHAVIYTADGEKGSYSFYSIGHTDDNGTTRDNGAAFFHTTSAGKLSIVNNLVVVFKDQVDKEGNGMTIGWEWN